jgi:sugar phosphate isomerase/epimerase
VVAPYLTAPQRPIDAPGWKAFGARLAHLAERLADRGLAFAWHNHDFEMRRLDDGAYPIDLILSANAKILWQADVAWIARAGQDPLSWLKRYGGRIAAIHVKDLAPEGGNPNEDNWADIGFGTLDLTAIVRAAIEAGATLLVAEHDAPSDYKRFAGRAIETARHWR